ncbi:MAG: extensin family protein [Alphaproteobacteria bacterium]|nr:extensin family protein [Alphaproteobacteria bacterium]MBU1512575.1 extensin family protein [Alphaproteobacteria bacterium]MBU2092914.1 extensin family protein [Alphaproteobacteria bacterium]MBU2150847.1 extensin family protein [Alphaproteobacteria bacterium]MBU2307942.1 extensin family protein [Alphaproteobacteria bacterium]
MKPVSPEALALAGAWSILVDIVIAALLLGVAVARWAPAEDLPWTPLRLDQPVGLATGYKFARAVDDPRQCRAVLSAGGVRFVEEPDRAAGSCATRNTVRLRGQLLSPAAPVMTCPEALAYAFWTRHAVQPAARAELGEPIARVEHYGTYACRNLYGRATGARSQHAYANALDVAAFSTASGRRVTVLKDFRDDGAKGRFLRRVRDGACPWFRAVLSPDYNAAHRDHLHLDRGPFGACR